MISNNKQHLIRNPYQGQAKKVLCVCSAGLLRSPTAAIVLHRKWGYNTRSCGITIGAALIEISEELVNWADEIVIMESWMSRATIFNEFQDKLVCLHIHDMYDYMDKKLQMLIEKSYQNYLDE